MLCRYTSRCMLYLNRQKKCRNCVFYRTRKEAKAKYMKYIEKARENNVACEIDKFYEFIGGAMDKNIKEHTNTVLWLKKR